MSPKLLVQAIDVNIDIRKPFCVKRLISCVLIARELKRERNLKGNNELIVFILFQYFPSMFLWYDNSAKIVLYDLSLIVEYNKGRFCNNSNIDTLILKPLSVENKAKPSQLVTQNTFSIILLKHVKGSYFLPLQSIY